MGAATSLARRGIAAATALFGTYVLYLDEYGRPRFLRDRLREMNRKFLQYPRGVRLFSGAGLATACSLYHKVLVSSWPELSVGGAVPDARVTVLGDGGTAATDASLASLCRAENRPLVLNLGSLT